MFVVSHRRRLRIAPPSFRAGVPSGSVRGLYSGTHIRNGGPRKIDRVAGPVRDHLHYVGIADLARILDALLQRTHLDILVVEQRQNGGVNRGGIDQRLVALYVYDQFGCIGGGHFRHPVGTRGVVRARHTHRRAEAARGGGNAFIVGGDNDDGQVTGFGGAFEYMLQHRLGADSSERLAWETGRSVTRRDNAQNFTAHRRFYHGIAVLHSWKKERLGSCDRPAI